MPQIDLSDADFDALDRQRDEARLRAAAVLTPALAPEQLGQADRLARQRGLPTSVVADNFADYAAQEQAAQVVAAGQINPALSQFLSDPVQQRLAQDDLPAVTDFAKKAGSNQRQSFFGAVFGSLFGNTAGAVADEAGHRFAVADTRMLADTVRMGAETLEQFDVISMQGKLAESMRKDAVSRGATQEAEYFANLRDAFTDPLGYQAAGQEAAQVGQLAAQDQRTLQAGVQRPGGVWDAITSPAQTARYYGGMVADSLPAMLASIATRRPVAGSVVAGEATGANTFADARNAGKDTFASLREAAPQALLEGVGSVVPLSEAFGRGARRLVTTPLAEGGSEAATEIAQTDVQDALAGTRTDPREKFLQALDAMVVGGVMGVPEAALATNPPPTDTVRKWISGARAAADKGYLDGLMQSALDSKLRTTSPAKFQDMVQGQVGDAMVYVPADALQMLFQESGMDPAAAVGALTGNPNAWSDALATGAPVEVPMSRYVTHMAESHAALSDRIRLTPDLSTEVEPKVPTPEEIRADIEAAMAEGDSLDNEASRQGAAFQDIYGQLITSGTEDTVAAKQALAVQAAFRTWEQRFGMEPDTLFQRYTFNINRPQDASRGAPRNVDARLDPLIEQVRSLRARGKDTTMEFPADNLASRVIAMGGIDPGAVGAGDLKGILRPGLLKAGGMTVERAAETLANDGLADLFTTKDEFGRPDYRELLEMLADENQGLRTFVDPSRSASQAAAEVNQGNMDTVAALMDQLEGQGIDVAGLPIPELRALLEPMLNEDDVGFDPEDATTAPSGMFYQEALPDDASVEQLRAEIARLNTELRTDRLTGMRNRYAFDEDAALGWSSIAVIDLDGMKNLNDQVSHSAGDELLRTAAGVMLAAERDGVRFYRQGGDEYTARVRDPADAPALLQEIIDRLDSANFTVTIDGVDHIYEGIGAGYGIGQTFDEADQGQKADKTRRREAGLRERRGEDGTPRRLRRVSEGAGRRDGDGQGQQPAEGVTDPRLEGTKVVGPDGAPMLVYHGTGNDLIGAFDVPAFFSEEASAADWFASDREGRVISAYLNIQNPLDLTTAGAFDQLFDVARAAGVAVEFDDGIFYSPDIANHSPYDGVNPIDLVYIPSVRDALSAAGYDGVVLDDVLENTEHRTWVAFSPEQVIHPEGDGILFQSDQPLVSALATAVQTAKGAPKKGNAAAWKGWLDGAQRRGEFKQAEREWMGLDAWLDSAGEVTREQLQEFVAANQLVVSETSKGQAATPFTVDMLDRLPFEAHAQRVEEGLDPEDAEEPGWVVVGAGATNYYDTEVEAEERAYYRSRVFLADRGVSLPDIGTQFMVSRITAEDADLYGINDDMVGEWGMFERQDGEPGEFMGELGRGTSYARAVYLAVENIADHTVEGGHNFGALQADQAPYSSMVLPGGENYRVLLLQLPATKPDTPELRALVDAGQLDRAAALEERLKQDTVYKSGHFGEPNVVAHVRFDERTDADGKRVLMIQELQSDWHQQGRKKGYRGVERVVYPDVAGLAADLGWVLAPADHKNAGRFGVDLDRGYTHVTYPDGSETLYLTSALPPVLKDSWRKHKQDQFYRGKGEMPDAEWSALSALQADLAWDDNAQGSQAVPDAPFKTTWPELVMKRMVRYAAENGFDRVAWPTEAMVPLVEKWPWTAAEIRADPDNAKRYGAILDRYAVDLPRLAKTLAKKYGGEMVTSRVPMPGVGNLDEAVSPDGLEPQDPVGPWDEDDNMSPAAWLPEFHPFSDEDASVFDEAEDFPNGDIPLMGHGARMYVANHRMDAGFVVAGNYLELHPLEWESFRIPWTDLAAGGFLGLAENGPYSANAGRAFAEQLLRSADFWRFASRYNGEGDMSLAPPASLLHQEAPSPASDLQAVPAIEITDKMREAALEGLPLFQGGGEKRGGITGADGRSIIGDKPGADGKRTFNIHLFAGMNYSTFLHENAHAFLEIFGDLAEDEAAPQQVKDDWQKALAFLGVDSRAGIGREQHELWARAGEAYLREGKAPSVALRRAFTAFRVWLTGIYRTALSLRVELTDEVRGVFDRLYATDAEIAEVRRVQGHDAMFRHGETIGMTPEQAQAYWNAVDAAQADAETALAVEVLTEQQKAARAFLSSERRKVRDEVEATTRALRPYRALRWLRQGLLPDGSPAPLAVKLSRQALLDGGYLPAFIQRHLARTYSKTGGYSLEAAAELLGYGSGQEMVQELVSAPPIADVIKADTDRIMAERYPDPLVDGSLADRAMLAAHREKQAEAMLLGVQALERHVDGRVRSQRHVLAQVARQLIGKRRARDVQPNTYRLAEAKAGREALEAAAKQDWPAAASAGRRQLLSHLLYMEARNARGEVDKAQKRLLELTKKPARQKLGKAGGTYLDQIDGLLDRFNLRPLSGPQADRLTGLGAWIQEQEEAGYEVAISDAMRNDAFRVPFRDLTVDQVRELRDAVANIKRLADLKNKLLMSKDGRTLEQQVEALVGTAEANHKVEPEAMDLSPTFRRRFGDWLSRVDAALLKPEFLFTWLDGEKANGQFWRTLFQPFVVAEADEVQRNAVVSRELKRIFDGYDRGKLSTTKLFVPAAKTAKFAGNFTREALLVVGLNMGNDYNRTAMMDGFGWTDAQLQAVAERLTDQDWDTIAGIWALYESVRADAFALQKEMTGLAPDQVEATPFMTPHGRQMAGGYHPVKFDAGFSFRAFQRDAKQAVQDQYGGNYSKAATKQGHLKARTGTAGQPIKLSLGVVSEHLTNVNHDVTHRRALFDVQRLLDDSRVRGVIEATAGRHAYRALSPWLKRIGADPAVDMNPLEGLIRRARVGATVVNMGFKITTAIVQPIGYLQSVEVMGEKAAATGLALFARNPRQALRFAMERSLVLPHRMQSYDRDVRDSLNRISSGGLRDDVQRSFFMLTGLTDMAVAIPTWLGAYHKALGGDQRGIDAGNETDAIAYADGVIRQAQSAGSAKDLATIQRGNEAFRAFTMFYSYFSVLYNLGRRSIKRTKSTSDLPRLAASAFYLWFIPSVLSEIIAGRGPDDDEEWRDWMATKGLQSLLTYPAQAVPLLRDVVNGALGEFGYSPSPAFDAFEATVGTVKTAYKGGKIVIGKVTGNESEEEIKRTDIKNALMTAGYWGHLPSRQMWITGSYLYDLATGEEQPEDIGDVLSGLAFSAPEPKD